MKKRLFSGIQPSGHLHIGNYLGAIKNFVELQNKYDSLFCVVNYHAITVPQDPVILRHTTRELVEIYLAAGLDPKKSIIFVQSDISEHTELGWILNNFTHFGELNRMTQFKDKSGKQKNTSAGLFDYPVLMAADILLYDTEVVPVGEDQKQHVELARDIAGRFNNKFGKTFVVPKPHINKEGAKIFSLTDPSKKMSKSDPDPNSCIYLSDVPEVIRRKFAKATTDSGREIKFDPKNKPGISNLLIIYSLFAKKSIKELEKKYRSAGYGEFKKDAAEAVVKALAPMQKKMAVLELNKSISEKVLKEGAAKAKKIAAKKLAEVKKKIGVL